jgi:CzcA family heavy metal efflux pump
MHDVEQSLRDSNLNVAGGYLQKESLELLARGIGRLPSSNDLKKVVVKRGEHRHVLLEDVAQVVEREQAKRGDASVNGKPAVVLTIQKQPGFDTRKLTENIESALIDLQKSLPSDVVLQTTYKQREFIDFSVANVIEALRDGGILVVIVLVIFLVNFRTTFITLTAIPLSVLTTTLVFRWFGFSINVMTLGGLAVAMGELVDDAIVDVENIFQRLRQNAQLPTPLPLLTVIYEASREVRGAIIISTTLIVLVFLPLFALEGMEGRLFTPLAVAYIVSILASTVVSLTVTPVLARYLLPNAKATHEIEDGFVLRSLKRMMTPIIRLSMSGFGLSTILGFVSLSIVASVVALNFMGTSFLPQFDEGAAQVNVFLPPGTSLQTSRAVSRIVDQRLTWFLKSDEKPQFPIEYFTCRTGRAEEDEHVMGVNVSEYVLSMNPQMNPRLRRNDIIKLLHEDLKAVPGVEIEVEQPIAHLISHMLSGVQAQIAIKLFGDDLDVLRSKAYEIKGAIENIDGIAAPVVEQQEPIPQLRIELNRDQLAKYGLSARYVNEHVETALNGRAVTKLLEGQRTFDVIVRFEDHYREDYTELGRMHLHLPDGKLIPLSEVAQVYESAGPNTINREDSRRRIVVRVNTMGRDLGSAVAAIRTAVDEKVHLDTGYFVVYAGQFEAQKSATRRILLWSAVTLVGVFLVLYSAYPSVTIVLQILFALPTAFVGGVIALLMTGQELSVASMVGFISLGGIAARNGILLVSHYLHLYPQRGFTREMILAGSMERLAPVLMTALTTGIGLIPLVIGGHLPGKEILYPVATVILGGLTASTICEFLIHPGLFWFFSGRATARLATRSTSEIEPD